MAGLTLAFEMMPDQARGEDLDAIAAMVGVDRRSHHGADEPDGDLRHRVLAAYSSPMIWRAPGAVSYTDGL